MPEPDHEEKKLYDELEDLYSQVAESDKSEAKEGEGEILQDYYQSLQVSADAPLETIQEVYERLINFWDPGRFADNPSVREKAETKLREITQAYEKILAIRQKESSFRPAESSMNIPEPSDSLSPDEKNIPPFKWGRIFTGGAAFLVLGLGIFFWPTFYQYETIPSGSQTYQVRTNRITGTTTYFDGEKWNLLPIPAAKSVPAAVPPAAPSTPSAHPPLPVTAATEPITESKAPRKEEAGPGMETRQTPPTTGYAIQIGAMSNRNAAEEIAEKQRKGGQQAYTVIVKRKDQGVLYKVYLGNFANKAEAVRFMKERRIKDIFPDCFIQELS